VIDQAELAQALADPVRLRILDHLSSGPARAQALAEVAGLAPSALSRHLKILRDSGLVDRIDVAADGRGRQYRLQPEVLDPLLRLLHSTRWTVELGAASDHPRAQILLARMGAFLDAFSNADEAFFQRHLRKDVALVFPFESEPINKDGCLQAVASHPPWMKHRVIGEPLVQHLPGNATLLTFLAVVQSANDPDERPMFITACFEEPEPWELIHLQWTPATITTTTTT
jgi:DNA-binding transcriptional ArsR family regulator